MRRFFAFSITALLATTAYAADASPVTRPQLPHAIAKSHAVPLPLAIVRETGGFCGARCPVTVLTLHDNGHVVAETTVFFPEQATSHLMVAQLNKKLVDVFQYEISRLTEAPLIDFDPKGPVCADKAEKDFVVVRDGKEMIIGAERDCHNYYMENLEGMGLVEVLKSLSLVYSYSLMHVPSETPSK